MTTTIYSPGTMIGSYEIASNPMIGGMGVVYFALDHADDGRPVALKTFKPEYLPDRAARDRFLREGTAWVQLGRHLKPENILVGADKLPGTNVNRLRVTDFGLEAILKDESGRMKGEDGSEAIGRTHLTHGIVGSNSQYGNLVGHGVCKSVDSDTQSGAELTL